MCANDLAEAMKTNPRLKIMVNGGYYDLATPFFAAQYEEKHLPIPQSLAKNIEYDWYESGHMVYRPRREPQAASRPRSRVHPEHAHAAKIERGLASRSILCSAPLCARRHPGNGGQSHKINRESKIKELKQCRVKH